MLQLGIIAYLVQSFAYLSKVRLLSTPQSWRPRALPQHCVPAPVAPADCPRTPQALSFASPKAVLTALFPRPQPAAPAADSATARVAAYRRYIAALERRGGETVPEFPTGAQWLNAPPLRLTRELQGRVVLLDFWTFCCINCIHILPDLAALERKYAGQPVTVVGVHSAKFDNEKDAQAVRNAVLRCAAQPSPAPGHVPPAARPSSIGDIVRAHPRPVSLDHVCG